MFKKIGWTTTDIVIIALTFIAFLALLKMPIKVRTYGDRYFHEEAKIMSNVIMGRDSAEHIRITRAPGPDFFYTIPYLFVNPQKGNIGYWQAAIIWTGLWMCYSMLLLRRAARNLFGEQSGKMVVFLIFIIPIHIYYSLGIVAEGLAFVAVCTLMYGWTDWKKKGYSLFYKTRGWWLLCIGLIALVLARPNALLIVPILICLLLLPKKWSKWVEQASRKGAIAALVVFCVVFGGITKGVKSLHPPTKTLNQEELLSFVALHGRFQMRNEPMDWRYWQHDIRVGSKDYQDWCIQKDSLTKEIAVSGKSFNDVVMPWVLKDITGHIFITIRQFFVRAVYGHSLSINSVRTFGFKIGPISGQTLFDIFIYTLNILNTLMIFAAIYWLFKNKSLLIEYWVLWVPWLTIVVFSSILYMEPRYLFPARPIILLMASPVIVDFIKKRFPKLMKSNDVSI